MRQQTITSSTHFAVWTASVQPRRRMQKQSGKMKVAGITERQTLGMNESLECMQIEQVVARLTQSDICLINQTLGSFQMANSIA